MAKKKKQTKRTTMTADELDILKYKESFQQFLPIKTVENGFIIDDNDEYYPVIELGTVNLELMTIPEKYELGRRLEQAISSFPFSDFQILLVPMPWDLEAWSIQVRKRLRELSAQRDELSSLLSKERKRDVQDADRMRELQAQIDAIAFYENQLTGQTRFVMSRIQTGQVVSQKAFFIPHFKPLPTLLAYQQMAEAVEQKMCDVALDSHLCDNQEIRNLLFVLMNPLRKDLHKTKPAQLSPVYRGGNE